MTQIGWTARITQRLPAHTQQTDRNSQLSSGRIIREAFERLHHCVPVIRRQGLRQRAAKDSIPLDLASEERHAPELHPAEHVILVALPCVVDTVHSCEYVFRHSKKIVYVIMARIEVVTQQARYSGLEGDGRTFKARPPMLVLITSLLLHDLLKFKLLCLC